jgi:glycosyltransferase involved in cell wall biosynthesis
MMGRTVIRTRHLSTPIRKGLNSYLLYNVLANHTVTTCQEVADILKKQASLKETRVCSIPTGINPTKLEIDPEKREVFRKNLGLNDNDCLAGTLCVIRGWKGISDLLHAAKILERTPHLKWVIIGGGVSEEHFRNECRSLQLEDRVIFTGHLDNPFEALSALDIFLLLSYAHEGVSQASLQAAYLKKPLITTRTGGLKEVCLDGITGFQVDVHSPEQVAYKTLELCHSATLRARFGEKAHHLVSEKFTLKKTLDEMESVYFDALSC